MPGAVTTPTTQSAQLTVKLGVKPLTPEQYGRVVQVRVDLALKASTRIEVLFRDEDAAFSGGLKLRLGDPVSVGLRWEGAMTGSPLAMGRLTGMGSQFSEEGLLCRLVAHGPRYRLQHGRLTSAFQRLSSGQVLSQAGQKRRVTVQANAARQQLSQLLLANRPVARLVEEQAARQGLVIAEEGDGVRVQRLQLSGNAAKLFYGETLHDIRVEVNSMHQVSEVKVHSVNLKTHQAIVGKATPMNALGLVGAGVAGGVAVKQAFGNAILQVVDCPVQTALEARGLAQALMNNQLFQYVTAWGWCSGYPELKAGGLVELAGLGRRLSGRYLLTRVIHHYHTEQSATQAGLTRGAGFQTQFEACRPAVGR